MIACRYLRHCRIDRTIIVSVVMTEYRKGRDVHENSMGSSPISSTATALFLPIVTLILRTN